MLVHLCPLDRFYDLMNKAERVTIDKVSLLNDGKPVKEIFRNDLRIDIHGELDPRKSVFVRLRSVKNG